MKKYVNENLLPNIELFLKNVLSTNFLRSCSEL